MVNFMSQLDQTKRCTENVTSGQVYDSVLKRLAFESVE